MKNTKEELIKLQNNIKFIKDNFERKLSSKLSLVRVSAPLFVFKESGLNDELNGVEKAISFTPKAIQKEVEIVQSLAKWKRFALKKYGFSIGEGIYTDMNAIRKDEALDQIHSLYVDQWDWEKIITPEDRNIAYLKKIVRDIYSVVYKVEDLVNKKDLSLHKKLPKSIFFISSDKLLKMYPDLTSKKREYEIVKKYGACFIYKIGDSLSNGLPHDARASDYDDWGLNGDIIVYDEVLDDALELSSMGIRVDSSSLLYQLKKKNELYKLNNNYCQGIINNILPLTIGGGIGQSRLCMFMLEKKHIGEVQSSVWPNSEYDDNNLL